jgi:pyrroline-5-carboxylate reductase
MQNKKIRFIGGGNMAQALIAGLLVDNYTKDNLSVSDPDKTKTQQIGSSFGIRTYQDNNENLANEEVIVFCIKPQIARDVISSLSLNKKSWLLSIMAGVQTSTILSFNQNITNIVRAMPNVAALIAGSATGLYAPAITTDIQKDFAESIMRAVGVTVWVKNEIQMDVITAISGSGPAYFFLFVDLLVKSANKLGLDKKTSEILVMQTATSSAKMLLESNSTPADLILSVASKGGTTQAALQSFLNDHLQQVLDNATNAAYQKAQEIGDDKIC